MDMNEKKAENTPAGGVLVGKKDGQTIIHDEGTMSGYLVGKLHKDGGIKAVNKATGQPLEMQGGEVVITAPAVADTTKREFEGKMMTNREILSKINSDGGGVSFADGGDIPAKIHTTDKEYEFGGKMVHDTDIAHSLGMNSTLKKGKQQFYSGNLTYDVDAIYNAIKKGKLRLKTKEVETFPMKYPVYDKKYSETVKADFRKPNGITVRTESGEEVLIDGNHRMNNAYLNGRKTIKTYYIEDPKQIAKFTKKNKFELGGENKVGGHLSKGKSLKQIAEMHNVSLAHINEELAKGLKVEKEHFADFKERTRVAKDHLVENPNYYTILEKAGLKNGGGVDNDEKNVLKVEVTLYNLGINKEIAHNLEELHSIFKKFYTKVENLLSYDDILIFVTPIGKNDKLFKETSIRIGNGIKEINPFTVSKEKLGKTLKGNYGGLDWSYFFNKSKKYSEGGSVNLVEESKKGDHTARDLNNYNDVMDLQADGAVGGDDGLAFADGGETNKVKSISDLSEGDLKLYDRASNIRNSEIHENNRYYTYLGISIYTTSENRNNVFVENVDKFFNNFVDAENYIENNEIEESKIPLWIGTEKRYYELYPNKKGIYNDGGITPYDANLEGDSVNIIENRFAGGGVVYDSKNPKIEKVTIKDTKFNRTSVIGRNASNVSELQQIVSDYIGISPKEDYDWINFYVNDNTRGSYYIDLNKGKKNTVKNVNPETLNSVNFKRVIDANKYLVKNYDWSEFFELGSNVSKTTSTLKAQSKDPEYYVFTGVANDFTKGKIYKIKNPSNLGDSGNFIDDKGVRNGFSKNNYKHFKPSTEEAFLVQEGITPKSNQDNDVIGITIFYKEDGVEKEIGTINEESLLDYLEVIQLKNNPTGVKLSIMGFVSELDNKLVFFTKQPILSNDIDPENITISEFRDFLSKELFPQYNFEFFFKIAKNAISNSAQTFDFTDTKIDVMDNPELSVKVQKKAFEDGWEWENGGGKTLNKDPFNYLYFTKTSISFGNTTSSFVNSPKRKITEEEIFGSQAPTSNTLSKKDLKNTKIWIGDDVELRDKVIDKLIEIGIPIDSSIGNRNYSEDVFIYIYDKDFVVWNGVKTENFDKNSDKEIFPSDLGIKVASKTTANIEPYDVYETVLIWKDNSGKEIINSTDYYSKKSGEYFIKALKDIEAQSQGNDVEVIIRAYADYENGNQIEINDYFTIGQNFFKPSTRTNEDIKSVVESMIDGLNFDKYFADVIPLKGSQTPTISGSSESVQEIKDLKEAVGVLEGFASKASKKYNTNNYDEALQLLNEVKEEYSLALSFTPESSFMYERIELIKKINEIQKEITKITDLKSGGAYYILSKVIDKLERGEDWKESGRGEILTNDVPKQEIDSVIFTDRFKNWFGDWEKALVTKEYDYVSKALNENGMPSIMYHGAKRIKYSYRQVSNGVLYLAENRSYAEWFSANESPYQKQGDYLTQCFVNIKNPIDLTSLGVEELDLRDVIQFIDTLYPLAKIYDVLPPNTAMAIMNNQLIGRKFRAWNIIRSFPELNSHVRDNTNYDGFIYYENNPSDIVINEVSGIMEENVTKATAVFNSNQVKLVDAVLFDSSLDDWRFEIGGKVN